MSWEDPLLAAIIALTAYTSAVNVEIIRAGSQSIEKGQRGAARALGLTYVQMMRLVVLPQALRRMVPLQVSQVITLVKDTSLAFVIGVHELLNINYSLSLLSRRMEVRPTEELRAEVAAEAGVGALSAVWD